MSCRSAIPAIPLFDAQDIELHRQECAGLIGPNGVGKTTFLRTILQEMPPLGGTVELGASLKVGYFAQTREALQPENTRPGRVPAPPTDAHQRSAQFSGSVSFSWG